MRAEVPCSIQTHRLTVDVVIVAWKGRFVLEAKSISETKRSRYLLGLSSPAEREHIESEYFEDDDAFQEMLTAEDDLIDAYARGELTGGEQRRFEKCFVSSLGARERVDFARALAGAVSATPSVEIKRSRTLLDILKTFHSPALSHAATIAVLVAFMAVLAWLVSDRRRMNDELRALRAESAELNKRTEALQRQSETERTRPAEIAVRVPERRPQLDRRRYRERATTTPPRASSLSAAKKEYKRIDTLKVGEPLINTSDAKLGNTFVSGRSTPLLTNARNVVGLLSLNPVITSSAYVADNRSDQANVTLDGADVYEPIRIPISRRWIRFEIPLETAAIHEEYRITIRTADGRPVTSVIWNEPLTPNQTGIETPAICSSDLPSGDYVLLLEGKEPDRLFVKVAEYSFKVNKY